MLWPKYIIKTFKYSFYDDLIHPWIFIKSMLTGLANEIVEIEPYDDLS